MISITQDLKFKQAVVEYSFKHGVTAAAGTSSPRVASGSCCTRSCISLIVCYSFPGCSTFSLHRTFRCPWLRSTFPLCLGVYGRICLCLIPIAINTF